MRGCVLSPHPCHRQGAGDDVRATSRPPPCHDIAYTPPLPRRSKSHRDTKLLVGFLFFVPPAVCFSLASRGGGSRGSIPRALVCPPPGTGRAIHVIVTPRCFLLLHLITSPVPRSRPCTTLAALHFPLVAKGSPGLGFHPAIYLAAAALASFRRVTRCPPLAVANLISRFSSAGCGTRQSDWRGFFKSWLSHVSPCCPAAFSLSQQTTESTAPFPRHAPPQLELEQGAGAGAGARAPSSAATTNTPTCVYKQELQSQCCSSAATCVHMNAITHMSHILITNLTNPDHSNIPITCIPPIRAPDLSFSIPPSPPRGKQTSFQPWTVPTGR